MEINFVITSGVLVDYSLCHRKALLTLKGCTQCVPNEYVCILNRLRNANRAKYLSSYKSQAFEALESDRSIFLEMNIKNEGLAAYCDVLDKIGENHYEPTMITGTYSITNEQRLELLFVGYVIGKTYGHFPLRGNIFCMNGQRHKVNLGGYNKIISPLIDSLKRDMTSDLPPAVLIKHCSYCQFQNLCEIEAERNDDLSQLDRLTPRLIARLHKKGIFTVKQLSFTFKPRRSGKRQKTIAVHKPELQALALRTGKIYLQEIPELQRHSVELFLDIEGVPDRRFHYLIGLLVQEDEKRSYHSYWAETLEDEERIWQQFLAKATEYPDAPIYHFGSYEPKAIRLLSKRNSTDTDWLKKRLININSYVFGKVYFPVRSNKLKAIGKFIGATWTSRDASGLQSLVWRHLWEETLNDEYRQKLLQYNQEDCNAVRLLLDELCKIQVTADSSANIDYANHPKKEATKEGKEIHDQLETILLFAQTSYDKKKISFRQKQQEEHRKRGAPKGHIGYQRVVPEAQNTINLPCREKCPRCEDQILHTSDIFTQKTVIDLVFSEGSCTKTIKKFVGCKGYCSQCRHYYDPDILDEYGEPIFGHGFQSLFGRGLQSWVVYQRLALRMPYESIIQSLEEQFSESMNKATIVRIVKLFAEYYSITGEILAQDLLASPFIHVDETKVNVEGTDHYIWVFTDGNHVVFRWTESRESAIVREFLKNYKGVLISDFYAGYDSVSCRQQKCLVHLIRDLNDDLWKSPFDGEFEGFVLKVKNLLVPILEVASEYGLREEYLSRFRPDVSDFFERNVDNNHYCSELTLKYQKRFKRYRQSLFTFLEIDSIPWNNNQAERALRHIVIQASISQTFYKSVVQQYLLLLGIMQSCRCQEKSFLKFLLSGERKIDAFKGTSQLVTSRIVSSQ